jgi:hypothetical protein
MAGREERPAHRSTFQRLLLYVDATTITADQNDPADLP